MKLVFFDLETTGVNPGKNGIHQISGQIVIDGVVKESFDFHVQPNPKAIIEDEALKVAGVTREQVMAYPWIEVKDDSLHNAMYDIELTHEIFKIVTR